MNKYEYDIKEDELYVDELNDDFKKIITDLKYVNRLVFFFIKNHIK